VNKDRTNRIESFVVSPEEEGLRLDVFCAARLGEFSRSQIQKLVKAGRVLVGSTPRLSSFILENGSEVRVDIPPPLPTDSDPIPQDIPLRVVFEDDDLIVINKEAGLVVHPAEGNRDGTIVNALVGRGVALSRLGGQNRPGIVHRLDKDTSGVLVVAKTDRAYGELARQISAREMNKTYHAIVWGHLGVPAQRIDAPIARHPVQRQKMAVAKRGGREAITDVFLVDTFEHFDYIRVITVTGRTHQIRVHLSHIAHPVLGDSVYGGRRAKATQDSALGRARMGVLLKSMRRQALHASSISFAHPVTGQRLSFKTALPDDMRAALEFLYREERMG
jgi:23S rRNA pseudouridine1911/1915/1917 synthase